MSARWLLCLSLFALACGPSRRDADETPSGPDCFDGVLNQEEVDVDCGGTCGPCVNGRKCTAPEGCVSGACADGVCAKVADCEESGEALCTRLGKTCGSVSGVDKCGESRTEDCGTCPRVVTCTGAQTSGVSGSLKMAALSAEQLAKVCDFVACGWGGYGKSFSCGDNLSVSSPDDLAACSEKAKDCQNLLVSDYETCMRLAAAVPCNSLTVLFTAPECANVRACL